MVAGTYFLNEEQQLASLEVGSGDTPYASYFYNNFRYPGNGIDGRFFADSYGDANFNNVFDPGDVFIGEIVSNSYLDVINAPGFTGGGPTGEFFYDELTGVGYALSGTTRIGESYLLGKGDFWGRKLSARYDFSAEDVTPLTPPSSGYGLQEAGVVVNFNPRLNRLMIDVSEFPAASASFGSCTKTKKLKSLAAKDFSFIYNRQTGYLHYNANGDKAGFGSGGIFAVLDGAPKLSAAVVDFV